MGKGLDTGKAFYQGILGKITDPEQRAAAEKLLTNDAFLTEIGNGVEGQSEIDRTLSTLRAQKDELDARAAELTTENTRLTAWHGGLTTWFEENKEALDAAKKANKGGGGGGGGKEPVVGGLTEEKLGEVIQGERAAFLGFQRDMNALTREHFTKFKEVPDLEPLLHHPEIAKVGLRGVYELVHKERLAKFTADEATAAETKIRLDERQKTLAETAQMPHMVPTGAGSGSPLDGLVTGKQDSLVDAASAHYARLQQERAGAAPAAK